MGPLGGTPAARAAANAVAKAKAKTKAKGERAKKTRDEFIGAFKHVFGSAPRIAVTAEDVVEEAFAEEVQLQSDQAADAVAAPVWVADAVAAPVWVGVVINPVVEGHQQSRASSSHEGIASPQTPNGSMD